jgi:transposase-like protein
MKKASFTCPHCGKKVETNLITGRPKLNIPDKKVYDTLRNVNEISKTAKTLGCSKAYIYRLLKRDGKTLKEVIGRV